MRYDQRALFTLEQKGIYNPETSRTDDEVVTYDVVPCNLSPLSVERTALEFGDVSKRINIVRVQGHVSHTASHVHVDDVKYAIVKKVAYRHDTAFYIEEVV